MRLTSKMESNNDDGFLIKDPVHLLMIYHDDFRTGRANLYDWQIDTLLYFANNKIPKRIAVCAANGSGKSQIIVAPCAVWSCMRWKQCQVVVTSASGDQIDNQVGRALNNLCRAINEKHRQEIWKINYRHYECLPNGSVIDLYATDDPGKAEGYHPIKIGGKFVIIVDEAKSVNEEIFKAIARCTGWTHRLDVSSPGPPRGYFYRLFTSVSSDIDVLRKRVTYLDCKHISEREAKEAQSFMGEAFFRSAFLAEFVAENDMLVMTYNDVNEISKSEFDPGEPHVLLKGKRFGGIDLATNNDETVFVVFDENRMIAIECWRSDNSIETAKRIISIIRQYDIPCENIFADDGGLGRPIIDMIWNEGFNINRVLNQSQAFDNKLYANKGAELWFNLSHWIKGKAIKIFDDDKLIAQLASRKYTRHKQTGKIVLESKMEVRKRGGQSPDRADALALAFCNFRYYIREELKTDDSDKTIVDVINEISMQRKLRAAGDKWLEYFDDSYKKTIIDVIKGYGVE